jgi:3-phenylpropionate/trans-cinnamate dioxygenase ferredoxin reductase subunit
VSELSYPENIVLVGGGHACAAAVVELRRLGFSGHVQVVSAEPVPPYDRTTLSKGVLVQGSAPPPLWPELAAGIPGVDLRLGTCVLSVDPPSRALTTSNGDELAYDRLLIATGAEPRRIQIPGATAEGVLYLRDHDDARLLRARLELSTRLVVIGGGVIGLEVAAAARALGPEVTVVEASRQVLGRSVPAAVASALVDLHREHGVAVHCATTPTAIVTSGGRVRGVEVSNGPCLEADVVVVGIGIAPREELAGRAGLAVADGVLVDAQCRTSDPHIFAAGDVARMRDISGQGTVRLEAWRPAWRQAQVAAAAMLGLPSIYREQPWGWSDQYDALVQTVGICSPGADIVDYGDVRAPGGLLSLSFVDGQLVAAAGVSIGAGIARPVRLVQALLDAGYRLARDELPAEGDLSSLVKYLKEHRHDRGSLRG